MRLNADVHKDALLRTRKNAEHAGCLGEQTVNGTLLMFFAGTRQNGAQHEPSRSFTPSHLPLPAFNRFPERCRIHGIQYLAQHLGNLVVMASRLFWSTDLCYLRSVTLHW